jgi:hypothetical protein
MVRSQNLQTMDALAPFHLKGVDFDRLYELRHYKGKFLLTESGQFIAKIISNADWRQKEFLHKEVLVELGIRDPLDKEVKKHIVGGGLLDLELIDDYVELRLSGSSGDYGDYDPESIDLAGLERAIENAFGLGMMPVLVIPSADMK